MTKQHITEKYNRARFSYCIFIALAAFTIIVISGCGQHVDSIGDINDSPAKYLGQNVTVAGRVSQVFSVPFGITNLAAYKLDDTTGSIWVVTHDGAPQKGTMIGIKGIVKSLSDVVPAGSGDAMTPFVGNVIEEQERRLR